MLNPYLSMPAQDIVRQYLRIRRMQLCLLYGSFALVILGPALITAAAGAMNVVSALVLAGFAALFLFLIARFKRKLFPQNLTLIREVLTDACDPARYRDVIQDVCRRDRGYADVFSAPLELADAEAALGDEAAAAARLYALRVRYCLAEVLASRGRTQEALRCLQPVIDRGRGLALTARAGSLAARLEQEAQPREKRAPEQNTH